MSETKRRSFIGDLRVLQAIKAIRGIKTEDMDLMQTTDLMMKN